MKKEVLSFDSQDGVKIHYLRWLPESKPRAILQILHGMAEHASRYDEFALFLNRNGYAVYASDHRGHGLTAESTINTGYFADHDGWNRVAEDCLLLQKIIKQNHPDLPLFLLGHSMGSILARDIIANPRCNCNGVILSGTSWNPKSLLIVGKFVAQLQNIIYNKHHRSNLLDRLSFGRFNKKFKPSRTSFDWLSRVPEFVDRYVKDEYCGFVCSVGFFIDLFYGILKIQNKTHLKKTPSTLPVLLACGENDPVGGFTKGVKKVYRIFKDNGVKDLELKIYLQARHEILNETNRTEVYSDFLRWMDFRI